MTHLVLASGSPRRRRLLEALGFSIETRLPTCHELALPDESATALVGRLARLKATSVERRDHEPVLGADTVVVRDGEIIGKPRDDNDARAILKSLSGRSHEVSTGFCVLRGEDEHCAVVTSRVRFRNLTGEEINAYVATGEAGDKAGAYGIQEGGGALVQEVSGSYSNVVGLPVEEVLAVLHSLGVR